MQVAERKNIRGLLSLMKSKGYQINDKPYQLNIVGVRADSNVPNKFDDKMYVFWNSENGWQGKYFTVTTDPGTYWLNNPMQKEGTAILKQGQYINSHKIGLHQGKYKAFVQDKPVSVYRDKNKNDIAEETLSIDKGMFGINIHRANDKFVSKLVDKWSAGCMVLNSPSDFMDVLMKAEKSQNKYFTYTLLREF